jgi:hypothetical protein
MQDNPKCSWTGVSGRVYPYFIHSLPVSFNPNQDGNYIFSRETSPGKWSPIYIGEGDLSSRVSGAHHQAACMMMKGATHVHAHLNGSEDARKAEERDLLANYTIAYRPNGCNEKLGG